MIDFILYLLVFAFGFYLGGRERRRKFFGWIWGWIQRLGKEYRQNKPGKGE